MPSNRIRKNTTEQVATSRRKEPKLNKIKLISQPAVEQINDLFHNSQHRDAPFKARPHRAREQLTLPKKRISGTLEEKQLRREELEKKQEEIKKRQVDQEYTAERQVIEGVETAVLCPFCSEELRPPLPQSIKKALEEIRTKDKEFEEQQQPKCDVSLSSKPSRTRIKLKRGASNLEQFTFCRLHQIELVIKPQGKEKGYPTEINFEGLPNRIKKLQAELDDVIMGKMHSVFRDNAIKAYEDLGRNRARSTMGVMTRFETTLPGYYGSQGAAVILATLSAMFLHTGILTIEKVAPQLPMEYLQQVLVPEAGCRLIQEDLTVKNNAKPHGETITLKKALDVMKDSCEFGSMVHSSQDDTDYKNKAEPSWTEDEPSGDPCTDSD
ncbi:hypothetical protein DFQ28_001344 [Apophysomyces sp. BC1034]|nr:hypothetical protein DFQ30_001666 [Apophysomyces sp. BC1015]KAG0180351.1 hypothetical protein DFQ29_000829 [Apophysomyces sp. BC1021]KAG0190906.1 hypothetical protein DFQ28_001344 [Apophysomyces sp. BC1034]